MDRDGKIAVALSGGVDSSVSCRLMQLQGLSVVALFMDLGQPDLLIQRQRAAAMAQFLGVDFQVVDLRQAFAEQIERYFVESFRQGLTPNPCVVCNRIIKCGLLLDAALAQGCQAMATGHYVRREMAGGQVRLRCGADFSKDQSYFLCDLKQYQLRHLLFPLGEKNKTAVYRLAEKFSLPVQGGESQDICFLQGKAADFVEGHLAQIPPGGEIVDGQGQVIGHHAGIHRYTIGQRRGLGIPAAQPLYVVAIDGRKNQLVVGEDSQLYRQSLELSKINWLVEPGPELPWQGRVKIRYRHQAVAARLTQDQRGFVLTFAQPQRAITPGQFAVFYEDDYLLGGGVIRR